MHMIKKIYSIFWRRILYNKKYKFLQKTIKYIFSDFILYRLVSHAHNIPVSSYYNHSKSIIKHNDTLPHIIMMFNGKWDQPGFADCIRAITSVYHMCKINDISFSVFFNYPFKLTDFLQPNNYNWKISENEISYNIKEAIPYTCISYNSLFKERNVKMQEKYLKYIVSKITTKQIHLYSNTYCYDEFFHNNFHELFKPSIYLQSKIDEQKKIIGKNYISVSFRFANLLGDIKDTYGEELPQKIKEELIQKCLYAINELYIRTNSSRILLTSDSISFIDVAIQELPYIYVIPGPIGHIAHDGEDDIVLKTLLDLFLISEANHAYMIRNKLMYKSGFAKRAASIGNIPFTEVLIN